MTRMRRWLLMGVCALALPLSAQEKQTVTLGRWVGTWATAPQPVVKSYMPYDNNMTNRSVRQIVKASIGGSVLRLKLSNLYGAAPVEIRSVYIALSKDSFELVPRTARYLQFGKQYKVVIPAGKSVESDPLNFELHGLERLTVTINYAKAPAVPTVHMGSRTTSYILPGVTNAESDFGKAFREEHWFNIAAIDVYDMKAGAIAILGNSITDGKNSNDNAQNRWPDMMSEALHLKHRITTLGVIFEGVNDIGAARGNSEQVAARLIAAYGQMIAKAKARGLKVFLATITPFEGAGYYSYFHEAARETVNEWIRGRRKDVDGIIDFAELMQDPANHHRLRKEYQSDWLHPNAEGYRAMGYYAAEEIARGEK